MDGLCEVGVRSAEADAVVLTLTEEDMHRVIGCHGSEAGSYRGGQDIRILRPEVLHFGALATDPAWAMHPMVNGELDRMAATMVTTVAYGGHAVGMVAMWWRTAQSDIPDHAGKLLRRIAEVAERQIGVELTLSRLARDAFRSQNELRA